MRKLHQIGCITLVIAPLLLHARSSRFDRGGEEHPRRAAVVAYAKYVDVKTLDPKLPSERLDRFLARVLPKGTTIEWGSSDCENKPPTFPRPPDTPLCASIRASIDGRGLRFELVVGSHQTPITGEPRIEKLYILQATGNAQTPVTAQRLKSLSELAIAFK